MGEIRSRLGNSRKTDINKIKIKRAIKTLAMAPKPETLS